MSNASTDQNTAASTGGRLRNQSAFTLIEMLMTVFILGVVMLPLLMWAGLVFKSGGDTGTSDRTNQMTQLSDRLNRDVSGAQAVYSGVGDLTAATTTYRTCGLPTGVTVILALGRPDDGTGVAYYLTGTGADRSLHRFSCSFNAATPATDDTAMISGFDSDPQITGNAPEVIATFNVTGLKPIVLRLESNRTEAVVTIPADLVPVIDCSPACSVNRNGSATGSAGTDALKASVTLKGKYSAAINTSHLRLYLWQFGDEPSTAATPTPLQVPNTGIVPDALAHTYDCRSIAEPGKPISAYWKPSLHACQYSASLQVWDTDTTGGVITATTPTSLTRQIVQVSNNVPRIVVTPTTATISAYSTVKFDASATLDVDGTAAGTRYSWDFGDPDSSDNTATTAVASHQYNLPEGSATQATLTVTDIDGDTSVAVIPVTLSTADPVVNLTASCTGDVLDACLVHDSGPWAVSFDAQIDNIDPTARVTNVQWWINDLPVDVNGNSQSTPAWTSVCTTATPPVCPQSAKSPPTASLHMKKSFPNGTTRVRFSARSNKVDVNGDPIVTDGYKTVQVQAPPSAVPVILPGKAITPDGVGGAQKFILDGSQSRDNNPGKRLTSYSWTVTKVNADGTDGATVYPVAGYTAVTNAPIIGCTGTETMADGSTGNCPQFPFLQYGDYHATLTVTNTYGRTDTFITPVKVNHAPTFTAVVPDGQSGRPSAYRQPGYAFPFGTVSDTDGPTPKVGYTYSWTFSDGSSTITQTDNPALATPKTFIGKAVGTIITATLQVTDPDGGVAQQTMSFTLVNKAPIAAITAVSPTSPSASPFPTNTLNIFSARTTLDPGTTKVSASTSSDPDNPAAANPVSNCVWKIDNATVGAGLGCKDDLALNWSGFGAGPHTLSLSVEDVDHAVSTSTATITLRDRPTVSISSFTPTSLLNSDTGTIYFTVTGNDVDSKPASGLTYLFNFGDQCDSAGKNCVTTRLSPIVYDVNNSAADNQHLGQYKHSFSKVTCKTAAAGSKNFTNGGACSTWNVSVWSDSAWPHVAYSPQSAPATAPSATAPSATEALPNGLSLPATVQVRSNITPRTVLTGNVSSPIGPDGSTMISAQNGAYGYATCIAGSSCSYQADASTSYDPDGSADHLSSCTGPANGCLTFLWSTTVTPSGENGVPNTAITFGPTATSTSTAANPRINYPTKFVKSGKTYSIDKNDLVPLAGTTATKLLDSFEFVVQVDVKDKDLASAGVPTSPLQLRVQVVRPPTVGTVCSSGVLTGLPRNVETTLDGTAWGKAGTTGCTTVTSQSVHATGFGQYYSIPYKAALDTQLRPVEIGVDFVPKSGTTSAKIVKRPTNVTDFVAFGFKPNTNVSVSWPANTGLGLVAGSYTGTLSAVDSSSLTFAGNGPGAAFTAATGVTDVSISTQCGGSGAIALGCIPANNYKWQFADSTHPGTDCNPTNVVGVAAKVTFRTACSGTVTLDVTDENGGSYGPGPLNTSNLPSTSYSVADAKPIPKISTLSPDVLTDPTSIVSAQNVSVHLDGQDSSDPDGGPADVNGNATSCTGRTPGTPACLTYLWTITRTQPTTPPLTVTFTTPDPTYNFTTGTYNVTLKVTDKALNNATSSTVTVQVWDPPTVTLTSNPTSACSGTPLTCNLIDPSKTIHWQSSTTSPSGAAITSYAWDFGDGATATGAALTTQDHDYPGAGTYTTKLVVTDSHGLTATATGTVVVDAVTKPLVKAYVGSAANAPQCDVGRKTDCAVNTTASPTTVKFVATATSTTSAIDHWVWKVGGVTQASTTDTLILSPVPTSDSVTATVVTAIGATQTSDAFAFKLNTPPVPRITQGTTPVTEPVALPRGALLSDASDDQLNGATSSDPDPPEAGLPGNSIQSWKWTFVDDAGATGSCNAGPIEGVAPPVTFSPAVGCTGKMTLKVTDYDLGTATTTAVRFTVQPAPPRVVLTTNPTSQVGSLPDGNPGPAPTITLIGDASTQPGNPAAVLTYSWVVIKNTGNAGTDATTAAGCYTAPTNPPCLFVDSSGANGRIQPPLVAGKYWVYLRVTAGGLTSEKHLDFIVNTPPTALLTADKAVGSKGSCTHTNQGAYSCVLYDPSFDRTKTGPFQLALKDVSIDADGTQTVADWTRTWSIQQQGSPTVTTSASQALPDYTMDVPGYGTFLITMTVTDKDLASSQATAVVTVYRRPQGTIGATYTLPSPLTTNGICAATATANCLVNDSNGTATVAFSGDATSGTTIAGYQWAFTDSSGNSAGTSILRNPTVTFSKYDTFTATLLVSDANGAQDQVVYKVKLNKAPQPTVKLNNAAVTSLRLYRGTTLTGLTGPSTDSDGAVVSWAWSFVEDPDPITGLKYGCDGSFGGSPATGVVLSPRQVARPSIVACIGHMVLTATDDDGRQGAATSVSYEVWNVAPTARLSATDDVVGSAPFSPTFMPFDATNVPSTDSDTVATTPPRGDITSYLWSVYFCPTDGPPLVCNTTPIVQRSIGSFAEFTALESTPLTTEGTYKVVLIVTDSHGTSSDPTQASSFMTVKVVKAPKPRFTVDGMTFPLATTLVPGTHTFDGALTEPGGNNARITTYAWEVCRATQTTPVSCDPSTGALHVYPVSAPNTTTVNVVFPQGGGDYIVRLTVQDADFVSATSDWAPVKVQAP